MPTTYIFKSKAQRPTLEEAQATVGGPVQLVDLGRCQILVNEEGLGLEFNPRASGPAGQHLVGNAIVLYGPARWD